MEASLELKVLMCMYFHYHVQIRISRSEKALKSAVLSAQSSLTMYGKTVNRK